MRPITESESRAISNFGVKLLEGVTAVFFNVRYMRADLSIVSWIESGFIGNLTMEGMGQTDTSERVVAVTPGTVEHVVPDYTFIQTARLRLPRSYFEAGSKVFTVKKAPLIVLEAMGLPFEMPTIQKMAVTLVPGVVQCTYINNAFIATSSPVFDVDSCDLMLTDSTVIGKDRYPVFKYDRPKAFVESLSGVFTNLYYYPYDDPNIVVGPTGQLIDLSSGQAPTSQAFVNDANAAAGRVGYFNMSGGTVYYIWGGSLMGNGRGGLKMAPNNVFTHGHRA